MIKDKGMLSLKSDVNQVLNLDVQEIPSFPPVVAKLLEICSKEDASLQDLSRLVQSDPGISTKVLAIANSSVYGLKQKIVSVAHAVIHLGVDEVKKICLGVTVFEKFFKSGTPRQFDRIFFWRHCLCVATLGMAIAEEIHYPTPGEAYTCGLLHDFGKILFDLQGRVNYGDFICHVARYSRPLITEERQLMGMGHDDLGAYYCSLWHLPDSLSLAIKYHHQRYGHLPLSPDQALLISIVSLANFLSWTQGMGSVDIIRPPILQPEVEKNLDLNKIDFIKVIHRMDREMESVSAFYDFAFPSANQFRENLLQANLRLSRINTLYYYRSDPPVTPLEGARIHDSITAPHRSLDPRKIITMTLKAIYKDFNFDRLYVMKISKPLRYLKVIEVLDATNTPMDLTSIEIPIDKSAGGFVDCLRGQVPVVISGKTLGEKKTLEKFNITQMLLAPFRSHRRVIGILGMDNLDSKLTISPEISSAIAIVANELGMALENAGAYKEAKAISLKDGLTGLLNRLAMDDLLAKSFRMAVAGKNRLCVVMIDVDYFKKINDQFGHQAGDNILKLIATTLKKMSRPFDHVGRYGGEEFIVVLNQTDLSKALAYAERIRQEIQHLGMLLINRFPGLSLTVSAGVSEYQKSVTTRDTLIATADKALYRAKEAGRNRVESL